MARPQQSVTGKLKRDAAVFGVAVVGMGIILHFTIPWFDFIQTIGYIIGFAVDYPKVAGMFVGFLVVFVLMALVHDRLNP